LVGKVEAGNDAFNPVDKPELIVNEFNYKASCFVF